MVFTYIFLENEKGILYVTILYNDSASDIAKLDGEATWYQSQLYKLGFF